MRLLWTCTLLLAVPLFAGEAKGPDQGAPKHWSLRKCGRPAVPRFEANRREAAAFSRERAARASVRG